MTDFNALPLAEQLKALQAGDELHLRGGGWLPFVEYDGNYIASHRGLPTWYDDGSFGSNHMDIIRVHRPTARKVPEVVKALRTAANDTSSRALNIAFNMLADHFERTP